MNQIGQTSREELVHKFFVPVPMKPSYAGPLAAVSVGGGLLLLAVIAIAGSSLGSSADASGAGCLACMAFLGGLPALIWGGVKLMQLSSAYSAARMNAFPRANGRQMETWLDEGTRHAMALAPNRINRHPNEQSITWGVDALLFVGSPPLREFSVQFARDERNVLRASLYKMLVVFLSGYRLSTYECVLDMRTGAMVQDATKEYHLQHVDGIETASDRTSMVLPGQYAPHGASAVAPGMAPPSPVVIDTMGRVAHITSLQTLSLMVSGRRAVELVMGIVGSERVQIEGISDPSSTDALIHTLREHLRSHNGGVSAPNPAVMPPHLPG
jgi:hypothetical protein